jgi:hypothetical protein
MQTASATLAAAIDRAIDRLAAAPLGGYHPDGEAASEPIAWAAIALADAGRSDSAVVAARWLAEHQTADGSVGVTESQDAPYWPTALAMLAWQAVDAEAFSDRIALGAAWALRQQPWTRPRDPKFGHDSALAGWSWAPATHSWLEPTAFFVVALRVAGLADDPRRLEGVRLLVDRLLPSGGANYGNTIVFDQELLEHPQSSGVVAWALAGEAIDDPRLEKTIGRLESAITRPTGVASFAWAVRGLAAQHRASAALAEQVNDKLVLAVEKNVGLHKTALLTLAAQAVVAQLRGPSEPAQ